MGIQHPWQRDRVAAVLRTRGPRGGDLGLLRARPAHRRSAHGPGPEGVASVTVLGPDLATADAYATAAFAMGVEGPAWTAGLDGYEALTILADGRVLSTPGVAALRDQTA